MSACRVCGLPYLEDAARCGNPSCPDYRLRNLPQPRIGPTAPKRRAAVVYAPTNTRGMHHSPGTETEQQAAIRVLPRVGSIKRHILDALEDAPAGLIPEEFTEARKLLLNTVRRRFTDLWKEGYICKNGAIRNNARGNPSEVWVLGCDPEAADGR